MYKIAVIPGDGTGPEVVNEGLKVLDEVSKKFNFKYEKTIFDFGGERYLKTGEVLPDSAVEDLRKFDAIYLGAIGHPDVRPGILEKGILLRLRFELDQYINLRPVQLYDDRFCLCRDQFLQRFYGHCKVFVQRNANWFALGQLRQCRIGDKAGVRHQYLVSFLHYRMDSDV